MIRKVLYTLYTHFITEWSSEYALTGRQWECVWGECVCVRLEEKAFFHGNHIILVAMLELHWHPCH